MKLIAHGLQGSKGGEDMKTKTAVKAGVGPTIIEIG